MKKPLIIEKTDSTPGVLFNTTKGILMISGRSFPEYPLKFYSVLLDNLKDVETETLSITIELDYINTASTKCLIDFLKEANKQFKLSVVWMSEEDDEDIEELGKHMEEILEIEFEFRIFI